MTATRASRPRFGSFTLHAIRTLACVGVLLIAGTAQSQTTSDTAAPPTAGAPVHAQNLYEAGGMVRIAEPVPGDLLAAGGRVAVERAVGRDAALAGGDVAIRADIGEDLRAVGGQVVLESRVSGDAHIAAGRIAIDRNASIGGGAWLAGGEVDVQGRLPAGSRIHAGRVTIGGHVDGALQIQADTIELQPGARIDGTLTYASTQPLVRDPAAQIRGDVVRQSVPSTGAQQRQRTSSPLGGVVFLLGLVAAATVWALLFPQWAASAQAQLAKAPGISLALGAAVILLAPAVVMLLLITIVGAPLALALLAAYGLVLLAGYLVVAGTLGERLLRVAGKDVAPTRGNRLLALAASVVLLGLLAALPFLGWVITLLALMAGTGALVSRFHKAPPATVA